MGSMFPKTNHLVIITIYFFCVLFITDTSDQNCKFSGIFNFGDSNSDTGGLAAAFTPPNTPYGLTYFGMPAGRNSDGRLIIDFVAESLSMPYLSAYLDSLGTNFKHGANFATSVATIRLPSSIIPNGGYSPFYLEVQYDQFMQFISRSNNISKKELFDKDYIENALYTYDIGQNDLGAGFAGNLSVEEVNATVPDIVNKFSANVKVSFCFYLFKIFLNTRKRLEATNGNHFHSIEQMRVRFVFASVFRSGDSQFLQKIYEFGGRSFWIHNTGPIGCLPYIFVNFPSAEKDNAGCAKPYNEVAKYFNFKLKETMAQLRKDLPSASFTYVDIYAVKYSLYNETKEHGFEFPLVACCGYGGAYNFSDIARCGDRITVNNTRIVVDSSCDRPYVRVNWDGVHYTEAANKFIFEQISDGAFSDPPIPLKLACHKSTKKRT